MKLKTWTLYKGKKLKNIEGEVTIENEFPFLLLRPDLGTPKKVLAIAIGSKYVNQYLQDLVNRELSSEQIYDIFQDKIGLLDVTDIQEYVSGDINFTNQKVRKENIASIVKYYNIFLKQENIEFDTDNYSTVEKLKQQPEIFTELDFSKMELPQLLNTLNSGMSDYKTRNEELSKTDLTNEQRSNKTQSLEILKTNLILFFDQTLRKLDQLISKQNEQLEKLTKENEELKSKKK